MIEILNYIQDKKRHLKVLRQADWDEKIVTWDEAVALLDDISGNVSTKFPLTVHDLGELWGLRSLMYVVQPTGPTWIEINELLAHGFIHTGSITNARIFGTLTYDQALKSELQQLPPCKAKNSFHVALDLATGVDHPEPLSYPNARDFRWFKKGLEQPHQGQLLAMLIYGHKDYPPETLLKDLIESTYAYEREKPFELFRTQEDEMLSAITFALADKFSSFDHLTERHRRVIGSALTLLGK